MLRTPISMMSFQTNMLILVKYISFLTNNAFLNVAVDHLCLGQASVQFIINITSADV
jgi:hypothetical protein